MFYHPALESRQTTCNINLPQIIIFTIYCHSETSSLLTICSILTCILLSSIQMTHFPTTVSLDPQNLIPIPSHCWWTTVFIHAQLWRRSSLIAVTASQYVFMSGPLLSSFKTSPAVIFSGSSNNSEHKDESRWTQVHVKAAGLRPPTTLLSLDVIVSTGGRPRWFKARLGAMRSLCPRCHSQRQPKLAARCDWKLARSPDWAKIPQVS